MPPVNESLTRDSPLLTSVRSIFEPGKSATVSFVAGLLFMVVASAMYATGGSAFLIGLNAVVGLVLFVDGGRRLAAPAEAG